MQDPLKQFVAEFTGVFVLVFIGGGAIMMSQGNPAALLIVAVAHGLALGVMVSATMRVSGHINPAITLGFLATRRISVATAGMFILAQLLGATFAAFALKGLMPPVVFEATRAGGQSVAMDTSGMQAIILEALGTFMLAFAVFGTAVDAKGPKIGGFGIGLTLAMVKHAIGPLTGASLNPARSFGPAVASGNFEGLLIYFIGPIVGAVIAALLYSVVFLAREKTGADAS
jgi:MIP family channel proteins